MRKMIVSTIFVILSLLLSPYAFSFYDTFEDALMDKDKWRWHDLTRAVSNGTLNMKVQSCNENDIWLTPTASDTTFMKASVSVNSSTSIPSSAYGMIRLAGQFYNDSRGPGSGLEYNEYEGEVRSEIFILAEENETLKVRAQVWRFDEADHAGEHTSFFSQDFDTLIAFDTEYELSIEFTGTSIVFKCNNDIMIYNLDGPAYDSFTDDRYFTCRVGINEFSGDCGYMSAQIDNVYFDKTGLPYDTFEGTAMDARNWLHGEFIRQIEDDRLRLKVERCDGRGNNTVSPAVTNESGYIQAKVMINDGSVSEGNSGYARLASYFYNEKRGPGSGLEYNGYQDNIWATVRLQSNDSNTLEAIAGVWRSDHPEEQYGTSLQYEPFVLPVEFDQEYTLSMQFTGSKIIFRCNDEIIDYDIQTPVYESYDDHYYLQTRVYNGEGQCGFIDTAYDDLRLSPVDFDSDDDFDGLNLVDYIENFSANTSQITLEEFAALFGRIY